MAKDGSVAPKERINIKYVPLRVINRVKWNFLLSCWF